MMFTDTFELTDADWVEHVSTRLLRLDRSLTGPEVYSEALRLCARPAWRAMAPEAAADRAFDAPGGLGHD